MLIQIEARAKEAFEKSGEEYPKTLRSHLYAYYRILSQLTHTNLLGMLATVQPDEEHDVSIARKLPPAFVALILHVAVASIVNISAHTVPGFFAHNDAEGAALVRWAIEGWGLAAQMSMEAVKIHGLGFLRVG